MKKTTTIKTDAERKAANEKRIATMRANLEKLESNAERILSKDAETITSAERKTLLSLLNIAYHDSGKIETIASIDGTSACDFCSKMRKAAENNCLMICGGCYAWADNWKEAAFRRHKLNARILSSVLFSQEELKELSIPSARCRINEDGDVTNTTHARNILRIIETHKNIIGFGFWYKNVIAMDDALEKEFVISAAEKRAKYGNVRFVQSSVMIGFPARPRWYTDIVFTVYPDKETTLAAIKRGEWACNGRKCSECKYNCYDASKNGMDKNGNFVQYVAEFLRVNKEKRAEIMEAYKAALRNVPENYFEMLSINYK